MSVKKSASRRVALFTSSSFVAAGLAAAASLGTALTPATALAQAVCAPPPTTGAGGNSVSYGDGDYPTGITCTANGDMTVQVTSDGVDIGGPGIDLIGGVHDVTFTVPVAGGVVSAVEIEGRGVVGAVIDVDTGAGDIDITTEEVDADAATAAATTHAIRAISTSGAIDITTTGTVALTSNGAPATAVGIQAATAGDITINTAAVSSNRYGIQAESSAGSVAVTTAGLVSAGHSTGGDSGIRAVAGGAGSVIVTTGPSTSTDLPTTSGRLHGIYAQALGSGAVTVNLGTKASASGGAAAIAAVEARADTGPVTVNLLGRAANFSNQADANGGTTGVGIRTVASTDAVINIGHYSTVRGAWGVDAVVNGGTTTINVANFHGDALTNFHGDADGTLTRIRASGAGSLVANVAGLLQGAVNFSSLAGGAEINIAGDGVWYTQGANMAFSPGDDRLVSEAGDGTEDFVGGIISTGAINPTFFGGNGYFADPVHVINFGDGDDVFENGGFLMVSGVDEVGGNTARSHFEGETRFENLETFINTGVIFLGVRTDGSSTSNVSAGVGQKGYHLDDVTRQEQFGGPTDGYHDDILSMPGATFVGDGGEIYFDIDPSIAQPSCVRSTTTGELPAADCIILTGGATEGVHYVRFEEPVPGDRGGYNPDGIVLVDVAGGTSAQGHFVVSPQVRGYIPVAGGIVDKGFYAYMVAYDEGLQQHKMVSLPSPTAYQLPLMAQGGHSLWRLSTGTWFERQADIRGEHGGDDGAVWVRVSSETADREVAQEVTGTGVSFTYDDALTQTSYAVTAGADILAAQSGDLAVLAGLMLGYANSEVEYETSPNFARFDAWTLGAYSSFLSGPLFVDLAVNANRAVFDNDVPGADLFPAGTILSTKVLSVGAQLEAGWHIPLFVEGVFIEPLAAFSYVRSNWEDLNLPADDAAREGVNAVIGEPTSTRAGLGGRIGVDRDFGFMRAQFSVLGRSWEEFADVTEVTLVSPGADPTVENEFSGRFNELSVGASVYSPGGAISGFLRLGGRFADDYEAQTATAGIRVAF